MENETEFDVSNMDGEIEGMGQGLDTDGPVTQDAIDSVLKELE